ncbi:spen [Schistosoma japonicum]|uniref:Spen n=1 Tax=Schistosoma japonicum TaxID=6182 RepID=A0A4Z2D6L5_SCHJA|nr:spen [Schistosoma japonicum]
MKKTRFLWVRDLPAKCKDADLRNVLEKHSESIQKIRLFKEGHMRHAIVTFVDIKSATAVINAENKLNDSLLKMEYCSSSDNITVGIINHKSINSHRNNNAEISNQLSTFNNTNNNNNNNLDRKTEKDLSTNTLHKVSSDSHHSLPNNDQLGRGPLIFKRTTNNTSSNVSSVQMFNQVLRPVQSSTLTTRISNSYRGLKISDLPPSSKLSDAHLRQSLFTEFRRCGRIQSVVLPPTNGSTNTTRLAIVTFRRAEEAECAYQAIQGGAKVLFSTPVSVELHPGSNGNDELSSIKRSSVANTTLSSGNNTKLNSTSNSDTTGSSLSTSITTTTTTQPGGMNKTLNSHSTDDHLINNNNHQTMLNKSPTRTLHVAGLTVGPTGPVTSEQLTTAFRKFGDIINVQLKPTSNSALIQFAEMRGPIRAMNAHAREPLRLGGRPLTLAYTPSIPTTSLWISDLPASLASLTDEELLHTLSQIAPVQEIALINRMDQSTRNQSTPSISTSPHCAAYIKLHSTEHAIRLLTELRSSKRYSLCPQTAPITTSASATTTTALNKPTSRRPIAVDFASPRQSSIVTNLQLNASRSSFNSHRVRIISSSSVDRWDSSTKTNSFQPPSASLSVTTLTSKSIDCNNNRNSPGSIYPPTVPHSSLNSNAKTSTNRTTTQTDNSPCNSLTDVYKDVTDLKNSSGNSGLFIEKQSEMNSREHSSRKSLRSKSTNQSNPLTNRTYHQLSSNILKRSHDSSPSSLSTSSSSSSTSVSSDSTSSSSSSISSTSISSSGSSISASSAASSSRRHNKTPSVKSSHKSKSIGPQENKRSVKLAERSSSSKCDLLKGHKSLSTGKPTENKCSKQTDSLHSSKSGDSNSSWLTDAPSDSSFVQQPLRVMTMTSSVLSPIRSSAASSGGLSSPGGSSSSITGNNNSSIRRTPNNGGETVSNSCQSEFVGPSPNHHSSLRLSTSSQPLTHTPTVLAMSEFRVSPTPTACSVSASSGVSSGGPSFSSTNSSGGGSTGSSPLTNNNSTTNHFQSAVISKSNSTSQIKVTSSSPLLKRNISHVGQSNCTDSPHCGNTNKSRTFNDSFSSLKLHLSSNTALASSSPGSNSPLCCTSSTTTPLTVSIKLTGINRSSQPTNLISPCSLSENTEMFVSSQDKQCSESLPLTPVSAPPLRCKSSRHTSIIDPRRRRVGVNAPDVSGTTNDLTDWWSCGSPVYESMYDKIKRRTNKEAEERRQRQLEAFSNREKSGKKQRKKEQSTKSPPSSNNNNIPVSSPDSFNTEQCGKLTNTFSLTGKSHHPVNSKYKLSDTNNRSLNKRHANCQKTETTTSLDDSNHHSQWRSTRLDKICRDTTNESHLYSRRMSRNLNSRTTKRRRSIVSSLSSSLSSEGECRSNSPPETLTRLSLGMRFPVSATYHECIRPAKPATFAATTTAVSNRKWSNHPSDGEDDDDDDDALSQLSSSLSCSTNDSKLYPSNPTKHKLLHFSTNKSKSTNVCSFNSSPLIHRNHYDVEIRSSESNKKSSNIIPTGLEMKTTDNKSKLCNNPKQNKSCKQSKRLLLLPSTINDDRQKSSADKKMSFVINNNHNSGGLLKRQRSEAPSSRSTTTDLHPNKRKRVLTLVQKNINEKNSSNKICNNHTSHHHQQKHRHFTSSKHSASYRKHRHHISHSPKPYFSDDGTILDSEAEDVKGSFVSCSDSVSHTTTGTSDQLSMKDSYHHRNDRHISSVHSDETDESNLFSLDSHIHSPNTNRCHSVYVRKQKKRFSNNLGTVNTTTTTNTTNLQSRDPDGDSTFDALLDSDRFSANSKSTISTEPMEQCELDEDDDLDMNSTCLKFTDGDDDGDYEWRSGIASSSPNPVHLEFDEDVVDDDDNDEVGCELLDSKPEPNTITFQSDSFAEKLSNSIMASSDEEKPQDTLRLQSVDMNQHSSSSSTPSCIVGTDEKTVDDSFDILSNNNDLHDENKLNRCDSSPTLLNKLSPICGDDGGNQQSHSDDHIPIKSETDKQILSSIEESSVIIPSPNPNELKHNKLENCSPSLLPTNNASQCLPVHSFDNSSCNSKHDNVLTVSDHSNTIVATNSFNKPSIENNTNNDSTSIICTTSLNNPMDAIKTSLFDSTHSETSVIVKNSNVTREATKIKLSSKNDVFHQISCISTSPNLTNSTSTVSHDAVSVNSMCALPKLLNSSLILDNKPPVNTKTVSDKSSETIIQVDHTTPRQASSNNVVKPAISTLSSSISLNSQPTEVHDITRYVQSVIERVKAERVEENQQAAAAAAHCHHSTVPVMTIPISTLSTVSLNQTPKVYHEQTTLPGTTSSHNRRSYSGQRRSLLVTVSTCSPMKTSISSRSAKLISPNALVSSHPVTTTCNIVDESSVHMTNSTISSTPGLSHPKISTDLQLPSIPGVNACAPLNLPVIQLNNDNTRVTRQSSSGAFDNLQLPSKRSDICHNNLDAPTTSLPVNAASRRQRRSENKATSNALPVLKDNTIFSFSAPAVLTSSTTVNPSLISVSSVPSTVVCSKSTEVNILNNPVMSTSCAQVPIHISGTLSSIDCVQKVKSSNIRTSVDPYEPNFDEESPVGFHPVQLHPHRSPSLCPSPNPINQSRNKTPYSTAVNITAASSQPLPSTPLVVASSPPVSNFSSGLVILDSKSIRNAEIVACTTTSSLSASESSVSNIQPSFCVTSSQSIDTVDEVISDVCAGHFDVQSYLKSWSCNTVGTTVSTSNIQQPKVAINNVLPPHESIALSNIVTSISSCTPTVITSTATNTSTINGTTTNQPFQSVNPALVTNISNTPTGIPFPLPITSEPIVAAVTIPTGKASNLGKNDSNNAINIGTGSAVLNTLLAALQLIPGSQVTVTGPAAAAGVVGNLAVNNSRTISAATITLPVNAAQQAAANIKAAVLSVTNANNNQGKAINTNWNQQHQDSSNMKKTINECNNETKVSHAIFIPPVCVVTSAHLTSTAQNRQTASTHQTNTTTNSTSVFPTCPVTVAQLPLNNIHMNSSMNSASSQQHSKTLPSGCIVNESVTSVTTTASQLYQLQMTVEPSVAKPHLTSTGATTVTNTMTITNSISSSTCDQPFNATSVLASCGKYTSVTPTPISHHSPLIMSQQSNICTTKQSFIPPTSPTIINGPIHPQMTTRTVSNAPLPPSPPVMPGRNSSNVSSITNPVLQTLIDRLGGNVEPSVAIALFHAALNGSNMRRNLNDSPTDIQVNPYLRHVAQQFLDNRGCSGSLKPSMPISHSESQVHSTSVCAKSLSPSLTMQQIPVTNMNYTSSPHRPPASGLPFVSPIRINPVDSDISQVDPTVNNIISPPVVAARLPVSDQPPPINNNNATPNSDVQSCNTLGSSYPLVWQGRLSLKNIETRVALHFIQGNHNLLNACMTLLASGGGGQPQFSLITSGGPLRIVQRMRLEPAQLEGVQRKLNQDGASCACLALPTGSSPVELAQQTQILNENFIRYMQEKMAAGIINVGHPDYQQGLYVVHIFPPCDFSHAQLGLAAPDLHRRVVQANQSHLLVVITTV